MPPARGIDAPSSAKVSAPASVTAPPRPHAPRMPPRDGTACATWAGVRKIPEPIEAPVATRTRSSKVSRRANSVTGRTGNRVYASRRSPPVLTWLSASLRCRAGSSLVVWITGCASQGDGGTPGNGAPADASVAATQDSSGPSPDAIMLGVDAGDDEGGAADDATKPDDVVLGGKSCVGLPDGMVCGPSPDACHDAPVCAQGACAPAAAKADGFVCAAAPDVCHTSGTCSAGQCASPPAKPDGTVCATAPDACHTSGTCDAGKCGAVGNRPDGYNWSAGDATAICCSAKEVHADTDSDCGACGIKCNASNGESCSALGGHYFCRGCVASSACWSKCCSTSFSPYSCAASDCAGDCYATYCPAGTHCVSGGATSSDYCAYSSGLRLGAVLLVDAHPVDLEGLREGRWSNRRSPGPGPAHGHVEDEEERSVELPRASSPTPLWFCVS